MQHTEHTGAHVGAVLCRAVCWLQGPPPVLSQPSVVASPAALAALAAVLPPLHQGNPWLLLYSTARDGISLGTLMRKAEKVTE